MHSMRYELPEVVLYVLEPDPGHDRGVGVDEAVAVLAVVEATRACVDTGDEMSAT